MSNSITAYASLPCGHLLHTYFNVIECNGRDQVPVCVSQRALNRKVIFKRGIAKGLSSQYLSQFFLHHRLVRKAQRGGD